MSNTRPTPGGRRTARGLAALLILGGALGASDVMAQAAPPAAAATAATPRGPDGHPNLNAYWSATPPRGPAGPTGLLGVAPPAPQGEANDLAAVLQFRNGDITNLTNDGVPRRRMSDNLPLYKPEFWEKVLDLDLNGNLEDSYNHCNPMGIPRMGPPARIVQTATDVHLFYSVIFQHNQYRSIPVGPRRLPVDRDGLWLGDPVARWDGDTLVVETEGFNDQTWIGPEGFFHSYEMKVTERFKPDGDRLVYDVTVEDPETLQRPWVMQTRTLYRNPDPNFRMEESAPCSDRDLKNMVGKQREM